MAVEDVFKLQNTPTPNPKAATKLKAIKDTHFYNPLPADDIDGGVILPKDYHAKLQGAKVILTFALKHYHIGARSESVHGSNMYVADIVKIRVVEAAQPRPVSAMKRKCLPRTLMGFSHL